MMRLIICCKQCSHCCYVFPSINNHVIYMLSESSSLIKLHPVIYWIQWDFSMTSEHRYTITCDKSYSERTIILPTNLVQVIKYGFIRSFLDLTKFRRIHLPIKGLLYLCLYCVISFGFQNIVPQFTFL